LHDKDKFSQAEGFSAWQFSKTEDYNSRTFGYLTENAFSRCVLGALKMCELTVVSNNKVRIENSTGFMCFDALSPSLNALHNEVGHFG
jgi:hypothetical protein